LLDWLAACSKEDICRPDHVRAFLGNFAHYLKEPPADNFMNSKDAQTVVANQIMQSIDSLEAAIAIRHNFDYAAQQILTSFVNGLYEKLESRISEVRSHGFTLSMSRFRYVGLPDGTVAITHKSSQFTEGFSGDEWKYVGFRIGDRVAVELEIGSAPRKADDEFCGKCSATIGVHKAGLWKAPSWTLVSGINAREEARLKDKIEEAGLRLPDILKPPASKPYEDWHWFRYLKYSPFGLSDSDAVKALYLMVHDPADKTIDDVADFMIALGNVCTESLKVSTLVKK
jgi:hypothetical protein